MGGTRVGEGRRGGEEGAEVGVRRQRRLAGEMEGVGAGGKTVA